MAHNQRVLRNNLPLRMLPVKGSVAEIEVGDLVFFDSNFQANSNQDTVRPASSGSAGASAADGRYQFANLFAGVATQGHHATSYDKNVPVAVDAEIEVTIANSTGTATAANAIVAQGTKVGVAVNGSFVPLNGGLVQVDGLLSVTVADNEAIGRTSRQIKSGDTTCWVHIKSVYVFGQTGV